VHPHYQLGIDLGTTWTAASVCRDGEPRPASVTLGTAGAAVASVVFLAPDGTMLTGDAAQRRALSEPARVVREFKRRIGDGTPLVVGGQPVLAEVLSARFVARVVAEVAHREGGPARTITVTHPAEWGEHKRSAFAAALAAEGLPDVLFLTEPQAAAVGYASAERVDAGRTVAVYDLGGGTFDAAVVRKADDGTFTLLGRPSGIERLGGIDFDDTVFAHVREAIGSAWDGLDPDDPGVQTAVAGLRRECTAAKETLSADIEVMIPVLLPGVHTMVRLGRAEFEDMIRPAVAETVEALRRAIDSAGVAPGELDAVLLVGGSSRTPLVTQMVSAELGRPVAVDADPKTVVAAGAALAARLLDTPAPVAEQEATDPAEAPASPPLEFDAAPSAEVAGRRIPRTGVLVGAAVAVAVVFGVSASIAMGVGPVAVSAAEEPVAGAATAPVDPWTGDPLAAGAADPGVEAGEPDALTTPAGPHRELAVAARVRPVARNVPTGAAGAAGAAPARPDPAGVPVARPVPPVEAPPKAAPSSPSSSTADPGKDNQPTENGGDKTPTDGTSPTGGDKTPTEGGDKTPTDGTPPTGGDKPPTDGGDKTPTDGGDKTPTDGGDKAPTNGGDKPPAGGETSPGGSAAPVGGGVTPTGGGDAPAGGDKPA
jgi:molecular chaperone DnaK